MSDRPHCVDCSAIAPETNTSHTLISASFGWRLTRRQLKDGKYVAEWRCQACWRKHKAEQAEPAPAAAPAPAPAPAAPVAKKAVAPTGTDPFRWFKRNT